jgi:hypothetical protein
LLHPASGRNQRDGATGWGIEGIAMSTAFSLLEQVDRLCGAFATALHNSEPKVYATLVILLVLGVFLFPPTNDSDRI